MKRQWMAIGAVPCVLLGSWPGFFASAQVRTDAREAAGQISTAELRRHVFALAADSMKGRWTPSPELEMAADYIVTRLRSLGLRSTSPDATYLQRFPIDVITPLPDSAAVWATGRVPIAWAIGSDYAFPFVTNLSDWDAEGKAVLLRGPLDGAAAFDTTSLRGSVLLIPGGWGPHYRRLSTWNPVGIVWLGDVADSVLANLVPVSSRTTRRDPGADSLPVLLMSFRAVEPLLAQAGLGMADLRGGSPDTALNAAPLGDAVIHIRGRVARPPHLEPANVIGIVEGSDTTLRDEYVVFSAHYDHLGIGRPLSGDSIWNGADDNASGTGALLAVAGAFARLDVPPRRSIMFAFVSAEEILGLGSRFLLDHPPVPVSAMVANLNADMVGRNWPDTLVVVGRRESDLGATLDRVLSSDRELGLTAIDRDTQPNDSRNLYGWSDHIAFIRKGIPFLYFHSGMHTDYHRPTDSAEKIDCEKTARIARLMFYVGLEVANADRRPTWDEESYRRLVRRP